MANAYVQGDFLEAPGDFGSQTLKLEPVGIPDDPSKATVSKLEPEGTDWGKVAEGAGLGLEIMGIMRSMNEKKASLSARILAANLNQEELRRRYDAHITGLGRKRRSTIAKQKVRVLA